MQLSARDSAILAYLSDKVHHYRAPFSFFMIRNIDRYLRYRIYFCAGTIHINDLFRKMLQKFYH